MTTVEQRPSTEARILDRLPNETASFHARRVHDPLEVAYADETLSRNLRSLSLKGLKVSAEINRPDQSIEFATDIAYRSYRLHEDKGTPVTEEDDVTTAAAKTGTDFILAELHSNVKRSPDVQLGYSMRLLDLDTIRSANFLRKSHETGDINKTEKTTSGIEADIKRTVDEGATLLGVFQRVFEHTNDEKLKEDLQGKMFELLYMTYRRVQFCKDEVYDKKFVVGATRFEDNGGINHNPSHNYDVQVMNLDGSVEEVIQCKSNLKKFNKKEYADPITVVNASKAFTKFLENPTGYVKAFRQIIADRPDTPETQMKANEILLDELFENEKASADQARQSGRIAVGAAQKS